jgi:thiamine kinase-like enzyme
VIATELAAAQMPASVTPDSDADRSDSAVLRRAMDRLPEFAGLDWTVTPVPGGLTNRIYRLDVASGRSVVARLSAGKSALLSIDRFAECHNANAAAQAGAAPRVLLCDPDKHVALVEWIEGHAFTSADLDDSDTLRRVANLCRRLHRGPRFVNDFDMIQVQRRYLEVVTEHGFRLPEDYHEFAPQAAAVAAALAARPQQTVPCHNDLLAANILDDGTRLWFIDFEYAGNNDPYFEIGNIWSEAELDLDRLAELVGYYHGTPSPALTARARLWALLARYGWTLWAAIQTAVSDVDFDFWTWGMEKYALAVAEFRGPDFTTLLHDVAGQD